jgi:glutamyl-tRNA reductase
LDLSIPQNINPKLKKQPFIKLINVDELSKVKDKTLQMRMEELPKAQEIIKERMDRYEERVNQGLEFLKKYVQK